MVASTLVDLVKIYSLSTGTGALALGQPVPGYRGVEALQNGATYSYSIQQNDQYEFGKSTYLASGNQLVRSPIDSSNGGLAIDVQSGVSIAFVALSEDILARDVLQPLYGYGPPLPGVGLTGQVYYDLTPPVTIYGPKTESGWGSGVSLQGSPGTANVFTTLAQIKASDTTRLNAILVNVPGARNGPFNFLDGDYSGQSDDQDVIASDSVPLSTGAWVRLSANGIDLRGITRNASFEFDSTNPFAYGISINSVADGKQVDGIFIDHRLTGAAGTAGYTIHGIVFAEAGVVAGGAGGFAMDGPGTASAVVGNRYSDGPGNGGFFTRVGTGSGSAVLGAFNGTTGSAGSAGTFLKQNATGVPGGPCGTGAALTVTNSSQLGEAISSTTDPNNTSFISNILSRGNGLEGINLDVRILNGGVRTGDLTGQRTIIQPTTASTGTGSVTAHDISISANVDGAASTTGVSIANASVNGTSAYGLVAVVTGSRVGSNYGGYFSASGASNNFSIYCANGDAYFDGVIQAPNLQVFADNAAASASLAVGKFYRTATGQVMVVY